MSILSIIFSLFISSGITLSSFYSFYPQSPAFLVFLCTLSAFITLILVMPVKNMWRVFLSVTGIFITINLAYNFFAALLSIALTLLISAIMPYPKAKRRILFTCSTSVTVKYAPLKKSKVFSLRMSIASLFVSIALTALTFVFSSPVGFWGIRAFPVDIREKPIFAQHAVPSGLVTCSVAYDEEAIIVDSVTFFEDKDGSIISPAFQAGLRKGDVITKINNQRAKKSDFLQKGSDGTMAVFEGVRLDADGEKVDIKFEITPACSKADEKYMIGITYYPDILPGLYSTAQTISFTYPDTHFFAATAHSQVVDSPFEDYTHILKKAHLSGRDANGLIATPGEMLGKIFYMNRFGAFGVWQGDKKDTLPIAKKSEITLGKATILSSFADGEVKEYEAVVTGTYRIDQRDVICLKVEDKNLLSQGGIAKGMSGSPVIQNGKIIGALSNTDSKGICGWATFAYDMAHEMHLLKDILSQEAILNDT
ncbi:MAG: hypothetical protein IKU60_03065 [Clostridia bacterium]|nr:hypothetical protein [Clostridia bacterium]